MAQLRTRGAKHPWLPSTAIAPAVLAILHAELSTERLNRVLLWLNVSDFVVYLGLLSDEELQTLRRLVFLRYPAEIWRLNEEAEIRAWGEE